jgi:hypothetical protein
MQDKLTVHETIRTYRQIQKKLRLEEGSKAAREEAQQKIAAHEDELAYILGDRGFEEFVAARLSHYERTTDEDTAMCSCWRSTCPLKQGDVPPAIRQHGTAITGRRRPSALVTEWLQRHDGGEALSLARKEWSQMLVRVHLALHEALKLLESDHRTPDIEDVRRQVGLDPHGDDPDDDSPDEEGDDGVDADPAAINEAPADD